MLNKLRGTVDGIRERAGEIATKTSEANTQKSNEQRMAAAAERETAKELAKANLSDGTASKVMGLGMKVLRGTVAASKTVKNVSDALSTEPPSIMKSSEKPDDTERHKSITTKVPDWM